MGRALVAVGTLLVLLIGGLTLVVVLAREEDKLAVDNLLSEELTRAIALSEGRVDLRRVARFPWDEVLIVAPGTPDEAISERLGYEWPGELRFRSGPLLIFLRDRRVVRFADYRGEGTFAGFEQPIDSLPRERAVLRVRDLIITQIRRANSAGSDRHALLRMAKESSALVGAVEAERAVADQADLGVQAFQPAVGHAESDRGQDAGAVLAQCAGRARRTGSGVTGMPTQASQASRWSGANPGSVGGRAAAAPRAAGRRGRGGGLCLDFGERRELVDALVGRRLEQRCTAAPRCPAWAARSSPADVPMARVQTAALLRNAGQRSSLRRHRRAGILGHLSPGAGAAKLLILGADPVPSSGRCRVSLTMPTGC